MGKTRTPFVVSDGVYYLDTRASGIHYLVLLTDGFKFYQWKGDKRTYLLLDDVIQWHEKELAETDGTAGRADVLAACKRARAQFQEDSQL